MLLYARDVRIVGRDGQTTNEGGGCQGPVRVIPQCLRSKYHGTPCRAFSLIELLVVLGVLAIVLSLALPALGRSRGQARQISNLSNCRQLATLVTAYATDNKDLPPTLFPPVYVNPIINVPWSEITIGKTKLSGAWFDNGNAFHLLLRPLPSIATIRAVEAPRGGRTIEIDGQQTQRMVHFILSDPFYADPDYWTFQKQVGPDQWRPQRFASVAFPSAKGMLFQFMLYGRPGFESGFPACCPENVTAPVAWSDLSATEEVLGRLRSGVPNAWHHGIPGPPTVGSKASPLMGTERGILGRDR
jgi:prepilin-type N-terminal cleavage/methylation domain-containing protein